MPTSRRALLTLLPAAAGLAQPPISDDESQTRTEECSGLASEIERMFADLPGRISFRLLAPRAGGAPQFEASLDAGLKLFSASANKAIILCERLRQLDAPNIEESLVTHQLRLDDEVWSPGSPIFNPPDLTGLVSERTAMEAMVVHSDNTATDMILKEATPRRVRRFIAAAGMKNTLIPDSTRALAGYLFGAANYKTISWEEVTQLGGPFVNPPLNDVETLASSADDLVSFYARALAGQFFRTKQTLMQFRRILTLGDITDLVPFPIGMSVFGKAGYFDSPGNHARCIAGGMYFPKRWVYFAAILNWDEPEVDDPGTVSAYFKAIRRTAELVRSALGA